MFFHCDFWEMLEFCYTVRCSGAVRQLGLRVYGVLTRYLICEEMVCVLVWCTELLGMLCLCLLTLFVWAHCSYVTAHVTSSLPPLNLTQTDRQYVCMYLLNSSATC